LTVALPSKLILTAFNSALVLLLSSRSKINLPLLLPLTSLCKQSLILSLVSSIVKCLPLFVVISILPLEMLTFSCFSFSSNGVESSIVPETIFALSAAIISAVSVAKIFALFESITVSVFVAFKIVSVSFLTYKFSRIVVVSLLTTNAFFLFASDPAPTINSPSSSLLYLPTTV
jgi:hypothetical protein